MPGDDGSDLHLANLPADIIIHIVKVGINSIDSFNSIGSIYGMTHISPRWKTLAKKHLPSIKWLSLQISTEIYKRKSVVNVTVYMRLDQRFDRYFGVRRPAIARKCALPPFKWDFLLHNANKEKSMSRLLAHLFRRCSRIERFQIDMCSRPSREERNLVLKIVNDVSIERLEFQERMNFHNDFGSVLSQCLSQNTIGKLVLHLQSISSKSFNRFISTAPTFVPSIFIQSFNPVRNANSDLSSFPTSWQLLEKKINKSAVATASLQYDYGPSLSIKAVQVI